MAAGHEGSDTVKARWICLLALIAGAGCGLDNDLAARYRLEREFYQARQVELDAYATYPVDDFDAWRVAEAAYHTVLLSNPARIPESRSWNSNVVADMERVALAAEIGLLRLDAVDFRFHDSVSHRGFAAIESLYPEELGRVTLEKVAALYDSLGTDPVTDRCRQRLRLVTGNPILWQGTALLRDSLVAVPELLAGSGPEAAAFAESFYSRIISTWPDSAVAARARDYRARVRIGRGETAAALEDLDVAARTHPERPRHSELRILQADLLAFSLDRADDAVSILRSVVAADPSSESAWWARVRLALIEPTPVRERIERLRAVHMDLRTPYGPASAAMYARALVEEGRGDRSGAAELLWRLTARYPNSRAALAAPLHLIRGYVARGELEDASSTLSRASDYYRGVIAHESARVSPRYLGMDCLLEAYLLMGRPQDAAAALNEATEAARAGSRVVAELKLASISHFLAGDPENSVEILKKTLVGFPRSRYSRCVRWRLQRSREARDERSG
jgi:tetratricopeptide (TPR) repeat protein